MVVGLDERQSVSLRAGHGGAVDAQVLMLIFDLFFVCGVRSRVSGIYRESKIEMGYNRIIKTKCLSRDDAEPVDQLTKQQTSHSTNLPPRFSMLFFSAQTLFCW